MQKIQIRFEASSGSLAALGTQNVVEAAGVEPASENVTGQEPTYLVAFTRWELPHHFRVRR